MPLTPEQIEQFEENAVPDEEIDFSDIPETTPAFWANARMVLPQKERITIRLDDDVLDFFRSQGRGYQTRINAVLRTYMEACQKGLV